MRVRASAIIFVLLALTTTGAIVSDASASKTKPQKDIAAEETAGKCIQTSTLGVMGCGVFPTDDTFADNLLPENL